MDTPPSVDLPPSSSTDLAGSSLQPRCRCEYPPSDEEAIEEPGLFDAATYILPSRRLSYGGFLQYRPPVGGLEAEVVRREPEQHLSILNVPRNRRLEARGGGKEVHRWFLTLPEQARELVRVVGFEAFVLGLNLPKMDWSLMTSLVERWWDTTNTFHFPSAGEMTVKPGDFSLLIGLQVGGASLRVDPLLWERVGALEWFLGKVPLVHSRAHIDLTWLSKSFMTADILTQVSVEQLMRAFLIYLLGQMLFANKDGSVHTQFLTPLQHLEAVKEFDWGLSALATLYGNLGACSRDKSPILGGHYRALELWVFEHLLQFPSKTRHGDANCIPRYERWLVGQWRPRSSVLSLPEGRRVLDRLTVDQVRFDPWGGVPEDAPLARSRVLDRTRSLLVGPFCRAWYLGDRVASRWRSRAEALQFVPPPPPTSMRSTSSMSKEDLSNARIRDWAGLLLQAGDYTEYCRVFLASAAVALPVAPVWPRAPSFVSFHSGDGEEERLALTPCATRLYMLPAGVSQVPAEIVQEWLHAYQSAEALVRRQRRKILELEAERASATGGEDVGTNEQSPSQRRRHD